MKNNMHYSKQNTTDTTSMKFAAYSDYVILAMRTKRFKFSQRGLRVKDNFNDVNQSPRPGIQNMATKHVAVATGQVARTSLSRFSHYFSNYIFPSHYDQLLFFSVQSDKKQS